MLDLGFADLQDASLKSFSAAIAAFLVPVLVPNIKVASGNLQWTMVN